MGDARRHKSLSWFGQENTLPPAEGMRHILLAPKCLQCGIEADRKREGSQVPRLIEASANTVVEEKTRKCSPSSMQT
jgi:hypothetical protein